MIISISGTPGTGKTEVAKALGNVLKWKVIHLNDIAEKNNLYIGYDKKRDSKIVDIDAIQKEIDNMEGDLFIESHYAHEMDVDKVIILTCKPAELRKRLEKRKWSKRKIDENIEAEIMEICKQEAWELGKPVLVIETSHKTGKEVARIISKNI